KYVEYNSLSRDLETDRVLYDAVLARLKEVDLTKGITNELFSIHELAQGAGPLPIPWVKTLIMGFVGGFALGVGIVLGLSKLDPSIHTVDQAEALTGLRVITAVPQIKTNKPGLLAQEDRHGLVAEAFRTLRASMALLGDSEQHRVFLFTSAMPSEGKTFSSANFAVTLAQQGFRTLYIDGDLRKPAVSKLLFGEHRKPGFTEVLLDRCSLEESAIPSGVENLDVITAGGRSDNPAELLATAKVEEIISLARNAYDRVVIDSAPVIAVSDSLLLAEFADVSCLILRANKTSRKSVRHAIRLLSELGHPPAGIVLNGLHPGRGGNYNYYAYSGRNYGDYGASGVYGRSG
ncbi:MAG: polysaccharide biosynthesis tyrosine autokinase, partial [Chthoniobacterales bacterium]